MPIHNSQVRNATGNGGQSEQTEFLYKHDHLVQYIRHMLEDCVNNNPLYGQTDFALDIKTIERRFSHEGLSFLTKTLPSFFDSILYYLETGGSAYPSFKIKKGQQYPVLLQRLVAPIYEDPCSEQTVLCMQQLYQICVAFKKLKGPYKMGILAEQLGKFVKTDQELPNTWPDRDLAILLTARNIIRKVLHGLNPFDPDQSEWFIPRNGPGATNKPTRKHERYRPHVAYTQLKESFDYDEWFSSLASNYRGHKATLIEKDGTIGAHIDHSNIKESNLLTSRFKFVHKTFGKPRCICIENQETQWLQQALRRALYARIESHPITRGYVSFTDQSVNGLIALKTSKHNLRESKQFATIDMSEASDRISRSLVEFLFADNPDLLKGLLSLSTRIIEMPKDVPCDRKYLHAQKYAPMGSALCFPVMGLIHFALVRSIIAINTPLHVQDIPVWVYGDDIIVHRSHAQMVFEGLPRFGMKLNREKSFVKSLFRESCGVHAYNGVNITPVRFKTVVHNPLSVEDVVSALQNEAAFHEKGWHCTAAYIRRELSAYPELRFNSLPIVGRKSPVLGIIRDDKIAARSGLSTLKRRWDASTCSQKTSYNRWLYKARVITVVKDSENPPLSEAQYYLRQQVEQPENVRMIDELPKGLTVRWQWLPDSAFYNA